MLLQRHWSRSIAAALALLSLAALLLLEGPLIVKGRVRAEKVERLQNRLRRSSKAGIVGKDEDVLVELQAILDAAENLEESNRPICPTGHCPLSLSCSRRFQEGMKL